MSFWPFAPDNQAEQPQPSQSQVDQDQDQTTLARHNTRSSRQPLHPPLGAGRAQNGPRSPAALQPSRQFFPPDLILEPPSPSQVEDAVHEVGDIVEMASNQSEIDRLTRVAEAAIAAATAATQALTAAQSRAKKPDLPPFDKKNIDLWIKRVEAAYQRAGVVTPKDKFAYLEQKFPVDFNITVNDYLFD